jgi:hypothetical protein
MALARVNRGGGVEEAGPAVDAALARRDDWLTFAARRRWRRGGPPRRDESGQPAVTRRSRATMSSLVQKKRLLSSAEIDAALVEVAAIADGAASRLTLVGGVALYQYGSDRLTADLDFAADGPLAGLPDEGPLSFGGYQSHTPSGVAVDVIIREDDYAAVFAEALARPRALPGVPVPVATPEQLVVMKMVARRSKDALDLEALLASGQVDLAEARALIRRLLGAYAVDDFNATVRMVEWRSGGT